jgi:cytoskeleton protein RodZ
MTDVNDSQITIEKKPTVGKRLFHAREAKKLTIAYIATELRLPKQTIELIENERWSELHGRAYARGYFTNYVRFLGLPEDELLAAFNIEYTIADPALGVARDQVEINNKQFSWLPSLLLITVLVIAWLAYQQINNTAEIVMEEVSSSLLSTLDNSATSSIDNTRKEYENNVLDMQELEQLVSPDTEMLINSEPNNAGSSDNSEIVTDKELDSVASENLDEEPINNDLTPENTTVAVLDLRFSDDCWAKVTDADNVVLLNKLMTKDDSIVLKGRRPLTVTLGRASVTQVRFNDELFDLSTFTQRDVARFTLGADS